MNGAYKAPKTKSVKATALTVLALRALRSKLVHKERIKLPNNNIKKTYNIKLALEDIVGTGLIGSVRITRMLKVTIIDPTISALLIRLLFSALRIRSKGIRIKKAIHMSLVGRYGDMLYWNGIFKNASFKPSHGRRGSVTGSREDSGVLTSEGRPIFCPGRL